MVPKNLQEIKGLGKFPSDWAIQSADDLTSKITKGTTPPKSEIIDDPIIPFLRVNNLSFNGNLNDSSDMIYVSKDAHTKFLARSIAYPGDILMNIVGPPLGKISMLNQDFNEYNMNQAIVVYRTESDKVDNNYFLHYLLSLPAQNWLQSRSKKTSGQQNLTIEICKSLPVPIPPLPEQQKIAKILSTWDKAISTTERLIENSTQQKKALMQQLLTGKKRLLDESGKRFDGEWEVYKLSKICSINKGKQINRSTLSDTGAYPVINGGITPSGYTESSNTQANTITISEGGNSCGFVGFQNEAFWCGGHCYALQNVKTNNLFLYQFLKFIERKIMALRVGSGLPNIQKKEIEIVEILVPTHEEQQKIATVLINADQEIDLLKQQLADLQQEKKALMQVLLTGKKRVVV